MLVDPMRTDAGGPHACAAEHKVHIRGTEPDPAEAYCFLVYD